jgi:hypothetical protein
LKLNVLYLGSNEGENMIRFKEHLSTTFSKLFFLKLSLFVLAAALSPGNIRAQISGATPGEPVIATGSASGTSNLEYVDATQFPSIQAAINGLTGS